MDLRGKLNDTVFTTAMLARRLGQRAVGAYAGTTAAWEKTSPTSYRRAQELLGRRPADRAKAQPLPEMGSVVSIDGIRMRIDPRMSQYNIRKLVRGRHTQHERALLRNALRQGDRAMELGGGIGMVAIGCSRKLGGENVVSFEPSPDMESLIRDNYALNDVSPTLKMAMVGETAGTRTFHVATLFSRSSAHAPGEDTHPVEVPVHAFSDEIAKHRPTVLVCDIQGGEVEFFAHADLSGFRLVLVEVHPDLIGISGSRAVTHRIRAAGFVDAGRAGQSLLFRRD